MEAKYYQAAGQVLYKDEEQNGMLIDRWGNIPLNKR